MTKLQNNFSGTLQQPRNSPIGPKLAQHAPKIAVNQKGPKTNKNYKMKVVRINLKNFLKLSKVFNCAK